MHFLRYLLIITAITILLIWWTFFRVGINPEISKVYRILIQQESSTSRFSIYNDKILASWILFYSYPKGDFFLFEIDEATFVKVNDGFYNSIHQNQTFLKEKIKEYYGIEKFDFELSFTRDQQLDFLNRQGGSLFFNLYSSTLPFGEVYISEINYTNFLAGIDNSYLQKITALSFWFNLLMSFQEVLPHITYSENFIKNFYQIFSGNMNYPTFSVLVKPLIFDKKNNLTYIRDQISFKFDKNSIESIDTSKGQVFIPYQKGDYDRNKIISELRHLGSGKQSLESQSITAQIKNATTVKRLAARAAGFFRLRGINIVEYLGFNTTLKHSVILDFSNYPLKREYIKKITKIDKVYHLFNYRENYDFGIYLGEDLYVLQNQSKSPTSP